LDDHIYINEYLGSNHYSNTEFINLLNSQPLELLNYIEYYNNKFIQQIKNCLTKLSEYHYLTRYNKQINSIKSLFGFIIHMRHSIAWPSTVNHERDQNNNYFELI
jgi:hypothetical protein